MTDIERLRGFMKQQDLSISGLAREMGMSRHTLHSHIVGRNGVTYPLVKAFTQRYGVAEAHRVFADFLAPLVMA